MRTILHTLLTAAISTLMAFLVFKTLNQNDQAAATPSAKPVSFIEFIDESEETPDATTAFVQPFAEEQPEVDVATALVAGMDDFTPIAEAASAAVVNINTLGLAGLRESSGSGVIISRDGYIMTNNHVIENGQRFQVTLADKRQLEAELVGRDLATDLALLKLDMHNLPAIRFGNSDDVRVGEWVLAVGNPFNLTSTITAGIVSAKGRSINILDDTYSIESFIQTDAVVNPGNSGGALINARGELIGINTAIISESGGYAGYSFAIPINLARKVIEDLTNYGSVQRALLGVNIQEVTASRAREVSLPSVRGVYVLSVTDGGSAAAVGLESGDVILSINDTDVNSVPELQELVARLRPGDRIDLSYFRRGTVKQLDNIRLRRLNN